MPSALEEYSRNYGARLAAALSGGNVVSALAPPTVNDSDIPEMPKGEGASGIGRGMDQVDPGSADPDGAIPYPPPDGESPLARPMPDHPSGEPVDPQSALQTMPDHPSGSPLAGDEMQPMGDDQGEGVTFRDVFKKAPEHVQEQQLTKLEQTLKQGNQSIDSAYDDLVKQLGAPPDKNKKLSRKEKGMLLMEFGLSMLANSRKGLATAAGTAGQQTLGSYQDMRAGQAADYNQKRGLIEAARTKDKAQLARESALESMKPGPAGSSRLPGKFVGDDGFVYFYDENNRVQQAKDEKGQPIKASQNDRVGAGGKEFESDSKFKRYMEIYGKDPRTGEPLSGLALQRVKQDALDYANDHGRTLDDLDLDLEASKSADDFIRSQADLFRDMTPDQVNEYRNKLVKERRGGLKKPVRSYLEPNEPTRGGPHGRVRKFTSVDEARAAYRRGEVQKGDRISVNGVEDVVE